MPAFKKTLAVALSASLLHGCLNFEFGDDDDDSNTNPPEATTSFSGKVADGYLTGAKVCLDLNSNKICDPNEPSTISTAGGEFSLDGVTQAQLDAAPLLVEIIVGETIDEDKPDTPIEKKYTLTAPAGYEFISPLTTMVQSEIEESGATPEEAAGAVQAKLGTTLDLEEDYVAGQEGGNEDAAEFERLHKVAQVTVVVLQENIELVEEVLGETEVSFEDLVGIIVKEVVESLDTIAQQVETAIETEENGGEAFDPDAVAESEELDVADVDTTTIEEEIEERETARETAAANIAQVLESGEGIHFFDADRDYDSETQQDIIEYYYGTVMKDVASNLVTITETFYNPLTSLWEQAPEENEEQPSGEGDHEGRICLLSEGTVSCITEERETISIEGDAVIVEMGGVAATRQEITGVSVDLTDKNILTFLDHEYFRAVDPHANFTTGATGYMLSFNRPNAFYAVFDQNAESAAQCWGGSGQANESGAWTPTDTLCNNVFLRTGDGSHETDGQAAVTLAELVSANAAVDPTDPSQIKGVAVGGGHEFEIIAEFVEGGTLNYYLFKHQYYDDGMGDGGMGDGTAGEEPTGEEPPMEEVAPSGESKLQAIEDGTTAEDPTGEDPMMEEPNQEPLNDGMNGPMLEAVVTAQWQETTVEGQTIIEYGIPPLFAEFGDIREDERLRFFVAFQGAVRHGGIHPAGQESDNEWVFNDAGRDQIKAAFDFTLTTPLEPCLAGDVDFKEDDLVNHPGATYAQFKEIANTECQANAFVATDLTDSTLVTDFGFLSFHGDNTGTFLGQVGMDDKAVLDFTWAINADGFVVVNAQASFEVPVLPEGFEGDPEDINLEELDPSILENLTFETVTAHLRLTLAKVEQNVRQISVKSFGQESLDAADLETGNGNISGEVWGIN